MYVGMIAPEVASAPSDGWDIKTVYGKSVLYTSGTPLEPFQDSQAYPAKSAREIEEFERLIAFKLKLYHQRGTKPEYYFQSRENFGQIPPLEAMVTVGANEDFIPVVLTYGRAFFAALRELERAS